MTDKLDLIYLPKQTFSPRYGDNYFSFDICNHTIATEDRGCLCPHEKVIYYTITIMKGKNTWQISKRYSEILKLYEKLRLSNEFRSKLRFPKKTWFNIINDQKFLFERQQGLSIVLDLILIELQNKKHLCHSDIISFLQLQSYFQQQPVALIA